MNAHRMGGRRCLLGFALAAAGALPLSSGAAMAAAPRHDAHASRYAVNAATLQPRSAPSASGRFGLSGSIGPSLGGSARGARFDGSATVTTVADCSDYIFADGFDQ